MGNSKQLQVGNDAERYVKEIFKKYGYWAYNTPKAKDGSQPVDIIALKGHNNWLVDVKHVRGEDISFAFARIEANQLTCMDYAKNFAHLNCLGFAIVFERLNKCMFLPYTDYLMLKSDNKKSVNASELNTLEEYLEWLQ